MVVPQLDVPLPNLEKALQEYLAGPMDAPFDVAAVDRAVEEPVVPMCALIFSPPACAFFFHALLLHQLPRWLARCHP